MHPLHCVLFVRYILFTSFFKQNYIKLRPLLMELNYEDFKIFILIPAVLEI